MGLRELLSGIAILAHPEHPAPRWGRVLGDALDLGLLGLGLLGLGMTARRSNKPRLAMTIGAIAGVTALDVLSTKRTAHARHPLPVIATVTINKPPRVVYEFVRKLDQLPRVMHYLASVEPIDDRRSRWTAKLPIGGTVSWEAELLEDRPGEEISWKSVEGSTVQTRGRVTFTRAPGRDSTEVRVELQLGVFGAKPTTTLARWLAKPEAKGDLRRLKQVLETGEVLYSDASTHYLPHPARPPHEPRRDAAGLRHVHAQAGRRDEDHLACVACSRLRACREGAWSACRPVPPSWSRAAPRSRGPRACS